jgi:two-component system OmpR family sensor kinase
MKTLAPRGISTRLLATIALIVATALVLMTTAFNAVLRHSLDGDATNLARARAAAALSTVRVKDGVVHVNESPDDEAIDAQIWVFDSHRRVEAPTTASGDINRFASSLAGGPSRTVDAFDTRLYVTPIVTHGVRNGTLVAGVGLRAYRQTARTSLLGSIAFALLLFGLVLVASRWLLRRSLHPVAEMTRAAADWSEHDPDRRFAQGEPHDELTSLAATLDSLLERLGLSLQREQRFSAEMSHELRTPLSRVKAEVELALARERTPDEHREALEAIGRSAEQMTRTVDALVAAARTASSPMRGSADARESIARAIEATRRTSGDEVIVPRLEAPRSDIRIAADGDVVERIVAPLLDNASKHASSDASVTVSRNGHSVLITVSDDGPGISPLELERIFQPGVRGPAAGDSEGAGLGLALARRLARAASGEITAQAGPGGRFIVRLPAG